MITSIYGTEIINESEATSLNLKKRSKISATIILFISISLVILFGSINSYYQRSVNKLKSNSLAFPYTLNRDGYEPSQFFQESAPSYFNYAFLEDSVAIIEPYADMYLFTKSNAFYSKNLEYYHFSLCSIDKKCDYGYSYPEDSTKNSPVNIKCSSKDQYTLKVNAMSYDNKILSSSSGIATCTYVRREIRDLSEKDLAATMEAMHELWVLDSDTGKKLYGDSYLSAKNLLEIHYFQASWRDTDHSHEGYGFLPHHLQMTNFFENSVQLIDPSVTVPYWDYTRDSYEVTGLDVSHSPMFTNKTFGSLASPKQWKYSNGDSLTDGAIPDGLWAFQTIAENTRFLDMRTGYNYMRSPWSTNPSPYISRFAYSEKELPTCANHLETFQDYDSLGSYLYNIETNSHGNAHFSSGGVLGCELLESLVDEGVFLNVEQSYEFCLTFVYRSKFWYRNYHYSVKQDCYVENNDYSNVENFKCGYECDESQIGKEQFRVTLKNEASTKLASTDTDTLETLRQFICNGDMHKIITGDQFLSSSAADPMFWPIHGTLERLYHAKYMTSGFTNLDYPVSGTNVCYFTDCYNLDTLEYGTFDSCCDGHYPENGLFDYESVSRLSFIGLTNSEFLAATNPTSKSYSMSYIYDNFQWKHCSNTDDIDGYLSSIVN